MLSGIKSFLVEKFWTPVVNESVYYNPFNTTVYALLFGLAALYLVYPISKKMDIKFNKEFFIGVTPYIFLGGLARSLKDVNIINTVLLETPFIYFLMFFFTLGSLYSSKKLSEKFTGYEYHKTFSGIGVLTLLIVLSFYSFSNFAALTYFLIIMATWSIPAYLALKYWKPKFLSYSFSIPIAAHYFDASTTVASLAFGGAEKHVLAQFFLNLFGPAGVFVMKTAVIIPIVYYINNDIEGEERNYYLFLIALLGIAIGTRNLISLLAV